MAKELRMGPIDLYHKLGVFPWQMVLHILLLILCTTNVYFFIAKQTKVSKNSFDLFNELFMSQSENESIGLGKGVEDIELDIGSVVPLFSIGQLNAFVSDTVTNYYEIASAESVLDAYSPYGIQVEPVPAECAGIINLYKIPIACIQPISLYTTPRE